MINEKPIIGQVIVNQTLRPVSNILPNTALFSKSVLPENCNIGKIEFLYFLLCHFQC